jgi:NTP pyrophosphatase (non-canonical NTP hydrolase)
MDHLLKDIVNWSAERGIFAYSTVEKQYEKLQEEMNELKLAIDKRDRTEVKDAVGDCIVVLTNLSHMFGYHLEQCLAHAWTEIKDRKGKMIDGKFVKDKEPKKLSESIAATPQEMIAVGTSTTPSGTIRCPNCKAINRSDTTTCWRCTQYLGDAYLEIAPMPR